MPSSRVISLQLVTHYVLPDTVYYNDFSAGQVELSYVQTLTDFVSTVSIVNAHVVLQTLTVEASL